MTDRPHVHYDRLNIPYCASGIAEALLGAAKDGLLAKVGMDDIRAAVVGYLAAGPLLLTKHDTEALIEATLRKTVEKAG